jgi:Flp pilus assembly protein TadG
MYRPNIKRIQALSSDTKGNFGILFALLIMPLLTAAGSAIDFVRASNAKANLQIIADSAALASGATYNGYNKDAAISAGQSMFDNAASKLPLGTTHSIEISGQTTRVHIQSTSKNLIMNIFGYDSLPISVAAQALTPMAPKNIAIIPTHAQGWFYKKVSIIVIRPNKTSEEIVGTVTYQPTTQANGGNGEMVKVPNSAIQLGDYSKLVLKMEIKKDGCPIGQEAKILFSKVTCTKTTKQSMQKYDSILKTDDPNTSDHLYIDGKQLPKGVLSPLNDILECNKKPSHAWEDGGGISVQDFFYTVEPTCALDGTFVRLIK